MKRWPTKPLGDLLAVQNGFAFKSELFNDDHKGVPIIRIRDLARGFSETFYNGDFDSAFEVENGDFLIGMDGEFRCHRWRGGKGLLNQRVCRLQNFDADLNPGYVFYGINEHLRRIEDNTAFVTVKHLSSKQIANIQMPVPPLSEQERIVNLLDEADALRKLRAQSDTRTAQLLPALFHEMFGSPADNPCGWPIENVGMLFDTERDGARCGPFGSALKKHEYVTSGIPVWGIPNVLPNQFVETGSLFVSPSKFDELKAYSVQPGDLLISRAGTVGRICVAQPTTKHSIIGSNLIRLSLDRRKIVPEFFSTLMTFFSEDVGQLRANIDKGAYSFMNTTTLQRLRIYLPPLSLQQEFAQRVKEIRELQATQAASRQRTEDLFQSMLHKAFSGEL